MNNNIILKKLQDVGWKNFMQGIVLCLNFDHIGTAKAACAPSSLQHIVDPPTLIYIVQQDVRKANTQCPFPL